MGGAELGVAVREMGDGLAVSKTGEGAACRRSREVWSSSRLLRLGLVLWLERRLKSR